jgi:hypothetical protein
MYDVTGSLTSNVTLRQLASPVDVSPLPQNQHRKLKFTRRQNAIAHDHVIIVLHDVVHHVTPKTAYPSRPTRQSAGVHLPRRVMPLLLASFPPKTTTNMYGVTPHVKDQDLIPPSPKTFTSWSTIPTKKFTPRSPTSTVTPTPNTFTTWSTQHPTLNKKHSPGFDFFFSCLLQGGTKGLTTGSKVHVGPNGPT